MLRRKAAAFLGLAFELVINGRAPAVAGRGDFNSPSAVGGGKTGAEVHFLAAVAKSKRRRAHGWRGTIGGKDAILFALCCLPLVFCFVWRFSPCFAQGFPFLPGDGGRDGGGIPRPGAKPLLAAI